MYSIYIERKIGGHVSIPGAKPNHLSFFIRILPLSIAPQPPSNFQIKWYKAHHKHTQTQRDGDVVYTHTGGMIKAVLGDER